MNEHIKSLFEKSGLKTEIMLDESSRDVECVVSAYENQMPTLASFEKFTNMLLDDVNRLLQERWYELNNRLKPEDETLRELGIRLGRKSEVINIQNLIRKHYSVKTETPYEIGQRLFKEGKGISFIAGAVSRDSEIEECHLGYLSAMHDGDKNA